MEHVMRDPLLVLVEVHRRDTDKSAQAQVKRLLSIDKWRYPLLVDLIEIIS